MRCLAAVTILFISLTMLVVRSTCYQHYAAFGKWGVECLVQIGLGVCSCLARPKLY